MEPTNTLFNRLLGRIQLDYYQHTLKEINRTLSAGAMVELEEARQVAEVRASLLRLGYADEIERIEQEQLTYFSTSGD